MKKDERERKEGKLNFFSKNFFSNFEFFINFLISRSLLKILIAWDMLQKKMQKLMLSEEEQELIKQDILHKEAELNRKM